MTFEMRCTFEARSLMQRICSLPNYVWAPCHSGRPVDHRDPPALPVFHDDIGDTFSPSSVEVSTGHTWAHVGTRSRLTPPPGAQYVREDAGSDADVVTSAAGVPARQSATGWAPIGSGSCVALVQSHLQADPTR